MASKPIKKPSRNNLQGAMVHVGEQSFEVAFRKFKRKVEDSNLIRELQDNNDLTKRLIDYTT